MEQVEKKRGLLITYSQLFTACIVMISSVLMFWKTTDVRISALELRLSAKEKIDDQINVKLDKLQETINDVRITLQNKQDKK